MFNTCSTCTTASIGLILIAHSRKRRKVVEIYNVFCHRDFNLSYTKATPIGHTQFCSLLLGLSLKTNFHESFMTVWQGRKKNENK